MLILLKVHTNTPNIRDFRFKNIQWSVFAGRIHRKLGIFDEIFPKNQKNHNIAHKVNFKYQICGWKLRKIGFFAKTSNVLKSLSLQLVAQVTIVEHTENSHNS